MKQKSIPFFSKVSKPFRKVGVFFLRHLGVPFYRLVFFVRRSLSRVLMPVKSRTLYLISNRYTVHGIIILVALLVGIGNIGSSEVRAETFGEKSLLYKLVSVDDSNELEVVSADDKFTFTRQTVSYMDYPVVDANAHIDVNFLGDGYTTTEVGQAIDPSPERSEPKKFVAKRTESITYSVESGDTLGGIAEKHGLSLSTILWANNLSYRSTIREGQSIVVPPVDGVTHTVKSGDTLSKIATRYSADQEEILSFNKLASANDLRIGEKLVVPGGEPPAPAPVVRTAPIQNIFKAPTNQKTPATRGSATGVGSWIWPTDWRVITQYYGWRHTGIDVDGDYSTRSFASAAGTVIYSGWRRGYGLTVEVDHGGGLITRYAHHSKNYVNVGDKVAAGQVIAQTGTTGRSTGTHLHFEVIKNGKFQNPLDYVR